MQKIDRVKVKVESKFNQKALLKPNIDMDTELRKKAKTDFEKDFLKLMNNSVFGKIMRSLRKHRGVKVITTEERRNYLVSKRHYVFIEEINKINFSSNDNNKRMR